MSRTKLCHNGHVMEISWDRCPYCATGQRPIHRHNVPPTKIQLPVPTDVPAPARQATQFLQIDPGDAPATPVLAWLVALNGVHRGTDFGITGGRVMVGSREKDESGKPCDLILLEKGVSTPHATIQYYRENQSWVVIDERSMNGTFLNDESHRLNPLTPQELVDNDVVRFGDVKLIFKCLPNFAMEEFSAG